MKIKGLELNAFMEQAWPGDDWYWDHDLFEEFAEPEVVYDTDDISDLFWQGAGHKDSLSLEFLIKQWRKNKASTNFIVTIPNQYVELFKQYIASIEGAII